METVRFCWMTYEQLQEIKKNPLVPQELIIEALMERVRSEERPNVPPDPHNPRYRFWFHLDLFGNIY